MFLDVPGTDWVERSRIWRQAEMTLAEITAEVSEVARMQGVKFPPPGWSRFNADAVVNWCRQNL